MLGCHVLTSALKTPARCDTVSEASPLTQTRGQCALQIPSGIRVQHRRAMCRDARTCSQPPSPGRQRVTPQSGGGFTGLQDEIRLSVSAGTRGLAKAFAPELAESWSRKKPHDSVRGHVLHAGPTRVHVEPALVRSHQGLRDSWLPVFGCRGTGPVGGFARRLREPLAVNGQRSKVS